MFKPAPTLDVQITNLYQDITGRQPTAQQVAKWAKDILDKKLTLADLRAALLAAQNEAQQAQDLDDTARNIDEHPVSGGSWSALASAVAVPMGAASTGGSGMMGMIVGGAVVAAAAGGGGESSKL